MVNFAFVLEKFLQKSKNLTDATIRKNSAKTLKPVTNKHVPPNPISTWKFVMVHTKSFLHSNKFFLLESRDAYLRKIALLEIFFYFIDDLLDFNRIYSVKRLQLVKA